MRSGGKRWQAKKPRQTSRRKPRKISIVSWAFSTGSPKNQKEVVLLKFQQGMSYKEIQKVTGLKQGNIGFLIHTGLKRMREWMPDPNRI